jgi:hypothetical protein
MAYLNVDIPLFATYLDTSFLYDEEPRTTGEYIPVEVFSFTSINRRCGLFSVMSEMGSVHARVPIHFLCDKKEEDGLTNYPLDWLELWDSYGPYVTVQRHEYLKNAACKVMLKNKQWHDATYMMTFDWCYGPDFQTGQSENPGGHKQGHLLCGEGGQFFIQPGNRVVWRDGGAWISKELDGHQKWKAFSKVYSCELNGSRWFAGDDSLYFYEFNKNNDSEEDPAMEKISYTEESVKKNTKKQKKKN